MFTYDDYLFANAYGVPGVNLYYSADGSTWTMAKEASHGYDNQWGVGYNPTAVFKGDLYFGGSSATGTEDDFAQVWRLCVKCK